MLVVTWNAQKPDVFDEVIAWLQRELSVYFAIETVESIKAVSTGASPVSEREDLLQKAFDAGVKLSECLG